MEQEQPDQPFGLLTPFLSANTEAVLVPEDDGWTIQKPWGDESLTIRIAKGSGSLIEALNAVRLPPRLTALWHRASGDLEVIYGAISTTDDMCRRQFSFTFGGEPLRCEFAPASEILELVADAARPVAPSLTVHRNLISIRQFVRFRRLSHKPPEHILTSFWIRNVMVPESELPDLVRHLNFYMAYFDRETPRILVHEDRAAAMPEALRIRYPLGAFPASLTGKRLDPYLLAMWETSIGAPDPIRQFLYGYQVLEYAAFYYLKDDLTRSVRRILSAPDIGDHVSDVSRQLLEIISEDKTNDEAKLVAVVQQTIDPVLLWSEIGPRADFFSKATEFEGGFSVPALIRREWTVEDFKAAWVPKVPDAMRRLRNGLVHAREQRQARCVMPTRTNQRLMRPWAAVANAMANQLLLFEAS